MKKIAKICAFLVLLLVCVCQVSAQTDTVFWFAVPQAAHRHGSDTARGYQKFATGFFRVSTFNQNAVVTISQPANASFTPIVLNLAANTSQSVQFDNNPASAYNNYLNNVEAWPSNTVLNKGILIKSTAPVTAYYDYSYVKNPDIFTLKGANALGTNFVIPGQNVFDNPSTTTALDPGSNDPVDPNMFIVPRNSFDIVATEDNTTITITPKRDIDGHSGGVPFQVVLNRGQVYSARGVSEWGTEHLGGSLVTSDKPIAITIKDDSVIGGGFPWDLWGDQVIGLDNIGSKYIAVKGNMLDANNERVFVTATVDGTIVSYNGSTYNLNKGDVKGISLTATGVGGGNYISANHNIYLVQITGGNAGDNEFGGAVLPSIECTGSTSVAFSRDADFAFSTYVVVKSGSEGNFTLTVNGNIVPVNAGSFSAVAGSPSYVAALFTYNTTDIPVGAQCVLSNSTSSFQLGVDNHSGPSTGAGYGYFSDFVNHIANAGGDVALFKGDTKTLIASGGNTYAWSTGSTNASISVNPTTTTTYTVTVTRGLCTDNASIVVKVQDKPISNAGGNQQICNGGSINLTASGAQYYDWNTSATTAIINVSPAVTTTYTVTGTDYLSVANGITGYYYDNNDFTGLTFSRTDPSIDFNWGNAAPGASIGVSMGVDDFTVRWEGLIKPKSTGLHTFYITHDDGVRIWINEQLVIDDWAGCCHESTGTISLVANHFYTVKIEYKELAGGAYCKGFSWSSSGAPVVAKELISKSYLYVGGASSSVDNAVVTVASVPAVVSNPTDAGVCLGGSNIFAVTSSGGAPSLNYQWEYFNGSTWNPIVDNTPVGITYANLTTNNLTVNTNDPATLIGSYQYRSKVSASANGCTTATSGSAKLNVTVYPTIGPSGQPTDDAICESGIGSLTVTATGGGAGLLYQWQYDDNGSWNNVSDGIVAGITYVGSTTKNLQVTGLALGSYTYRCQVGSNSSGCGGANAVTSDTAHIIVGKYPYIDQSGQPKDDAICESGTGSLTVTVQGGGAGFLYQWQYNNGGSWSTVTNNTPAGSIYAGITTNNLQVTGLALGSYTYRCQVGSNSSGCGGANAVTSDTAHIIVGKYPYIDQSGQPKDDAICESGTGSLTVTVQGGGAGFLYQWQYNNGGSWSTVTNNTPAGSIYAGTTTKNLQVTGLALGSYTYRCQVGSNSSGCGGANAVTSDTAHIIVGKYPYIDQSGQPKDDAICESGTGSLLVTVQGGGAGFLYQWQYDDNGSWTSVSDGTFSGINYVGTTTKNLQVTGLALGSYTYRCQVGSNSSGCGGANAVTSDTAHITVAKYPYIDPSGEPADDIVCLGNTGSLTVVAQGGAPSLLYQWQYDNAGTWTDLTDGTIAGIAYTGTTSPNLTVGGLLVGQYKYHCNVGATGSGCGGANAVISRDAIIDVNPYPTVNAGTDTIIAYTAQITLNASASNNVSYSWSPADSLLAGNSTIEDPTTITLKRPTEFALTVADLYSNCKSSDTVFINVVGGPLYFSKLSADDNEICKGDLVTLTAIPAGGTGNYTLTWKSNPSGFTSSGTIITDTPVSSKWYVATMNDGVSTKIDSVFVIVNPLPVADAGLDNEICLNTDTVLHVTVKLGTPGYTYLWSPINSLDDKSVAQPRANPTVTTTYTVTIIDTKGCTDDDDMVLTVNPLPTADAGTDHQVCYDIANQLTASGGTSYMWSNADATASTTIQTTTQTTYTVTATDNKGCTDEDSIIISIYPIPQTPVVDASTVCPGGSVTINVPNPNSNFSYKWYNTPSGGTALSSGLSYYYGGVTKSDTIYLQAINSLTTCADISRQPVIVKLGIVPVADFVVDDASVLQWTAVQFTDQSTDATSWLWTFGESNRTSTDPNTSYKYESIGYKTINLRVMSIDGCYDDTTAANVINVQKRADVFVPTAFTPNGDNKNDVLYVLGEVIETMTLHIYNQWGVLLFTSSSQSDGWDGTYKGVAQPSANYTYTLSYTLANPYDTDSYSTQGVTTIIR